MAGMGRRLAGTVLLLVVTGASAQSVVDIPVEYDKLIQSRAVAALENNLLGDRLDLYSGKLSFLQTDVDLPGNSALQVGVSRSFSPRRSGEKESVGHFADWDLDLPYLTGVFAASTGWVTSGTGSDATKRCSLYGPPPEVRGLNGNQGGIFSATEYWQGNMIHLPGSEDGELLRRGTTLPAPGSEWTLSTKAGSVVRCLASLAATSTGTGEGFEVLTPAGIRYRFDHMISAPTSSLLKTSSAPLLRAAGSSAVMAAQNYQLNRVRVWIFPTQVSDRFGNTVTYHWNAIVPSQLDRIQANDGRTINFTWSSGRIFQVSDGSRSWAYSYASSPSGGGSLPTEGLSALTLPDGRSWQFQLGYFRNMPETIVDGSATCDALLLSTFKLEATMTHPGGTTGKFALSPRNHGRSWVDRECRGGDPATPYGIGSYAYYPREFPTTSLVEKTLSGPGLPAAGMKWTYDYGTPNHCWSTSGNNQLATNICTANSPVTKSIDITDPDGRMTRYTFGNRFMVNEGQLLQVEEALSGAVASRLTVNTYAPPTLGPYPQFVGQSTQPRGDGYLQSRNMPLQSRVITESGTRFSLTVDAFDVLARPLTVTQSSAPSP